MSRWQHHECVTDYYYAVFLESQYVVSLLCFTVAQMEEIVQKFGMVVISRAGSNPEKFIYESDILTKHRVFSLLFAFYFNYN